MPVRGRLTVQLFTQIKIIIFTNGRRKRKGIKILKLVLVLSFSVQDKNRYVYRQLSRVFKKIKIILC